MAPYSERNNNQGMVKVIQQLQPGAAFVFIIFIALIAFEIFNYSTTDHALQDLLGSLTFVGMPWSSILAIAFCGVDFAGIARLFTPEQGINEPKEVWYLFGAWLLAATMNAVLTWWGVSMAIVDHKVQSASIMDPQTMNLIVPIFVAVMVWVIRILIIGSLSLAMDRLLHPAGVQPMLEDQIPLPVSPAVPMTTYASRPMQQPATINPMVAQPYPSLSRAAMAQQRAMAAAPHSLHPVSTSGAQTEEYDSLPSAARPSRPEASYHSLSMSASRPTPPSNSGAKPPITRFGKS